MNWSGGYKNRFHRSFTVHNTAFKTSSPHQQNGIKFVERDYGNKMDDESCHAKKSFHSAGTPSRQPLKEINPVVRKSNENSFNQMNGMEQPAFSNIPCGSSSSDSDIDTDTCYSPFSSPSSTNGCIETKIESSKDTFNQPNENPTLLYHSESDLDNHFYEIGVYQGVSCTPTHHSPLKSRPPASASPKPGNATSHHLVNVGIFSEEAASFNSYMTTAVQHSFSTPFDNLEVFDQQPGLMKASNPREDQTYFDSPHKLPPPASTLSVTTDQNEPNDYALFCTPIERVQGISAQSPVFLSSQVITPSSQRKQVRFASPAEDMESEFRSKRYLYTPLPKPQDRDTSLQDDKHGTPMAFPMHESSSISSSSPIISPPYIEVLGMLPNRSKGQEGIPPIIETQQAVLLQDNSRANADKHSPKQSNQNLAASARSFPSHFSRNSAHSMFHRRHHSSHNPCRCRKIIRTVERIVVRTVKVRDVGTQTLS